MNHKPQVPAHLIGTPVSVHVLAEYVFCPRAGVLAFEEPRREDGDEFWFSAPRVDYLPDFDAALIEEALERRWKGVWWSLAWLPTLVLAVFVVHLLVSRNAAVVAVGLCLFPTWWLLRQFRDVAVLAKRLRAIKSAKAAEPDPASTVVQPANWWSLLKAGFSSVKYENPHADDTLGLVGRPWRVLHRGSLRIPVFRKIAGQPKLNQQHITRMAAYCHLVTHAEGGETPYSVVLFGKGYDGVAVPNLDRNEHNVPRQLAELRQTLATLVNRRIFPDVPAGNVCRGCHWGRPRVCDNAGPRPGARRVLRTRGNDGKIYHSDCGDRFDWVPGHELADRLGLREGE